MSTTKTASDGLSYGLSAFVDTCKSLAKLVLQTRRATLCDVHPAQRRIIVMGNGPSLRQTIADHAEALRRGPAMAVNFAANTPEFFDLRPAYYILVDPHFFGADDDKVRQLWDNILRVDWPMTLIVPADRARALQSAPIAANSNIAVRTINAVGIEGWGWLTRWVYSHRRGMPRPRNVLIPAIMSAIWLGYREVDIVGADHSWMRTLWVDDQNRVVSVQPHFYQDDKRELARVSTEYAGYRLHQIVHSFYVAFRAYHDIARYAERAGVEVCNCTPDSMIDAFTRKTL